MLAKFIELPLGTRFRYREGTGIFVILSHLDNGLVAPWQGVDGPVAGQTLCSAVGAPGEPALADLEVVVAEPQSCPGIPDGDIHAMFRLYAARIAEAGQVCFERPFLQKMLISWMCYMKPFHVSGQPIKSQPSPGFRFYGKRKALPASTLNSEY
jgi:hypothetical protein